MDYSDNPLATIYSSAWDEQIAPYVKDDGVYLCPDDSLGKYSVHQPPKMIDGKLTKTRIVSYAMNDQLLGVQMSQYWPTDRSPDDAEGMSLADIPNPSGTILLSEMKATIWGAPGTPAGPTEKAGMKNYDEIHVWNDIDDPGYLDPEFPKPQGAEYWDDTWGVARDMHSGGTNYAFCDGHVKWERIMQTLGHRGPILAFNYDPTTKGYPGNQWALKNAD
jgi:prepilin-type processing-associated H-X9-DG protein